MAVSDYHVNPDENTTISGINIAEGCPPSGINNAIRQLMADIRADSDAQNERFGDTSVSEVTASGSDTPRELAERFADVVNVKDFGAAGDGVADDTEAFRKAAAAGRAVFVPYGTYRLTQKVSGRFFSVDTVVCPGEYVFIERLGTSPERVQERLTGRLGNGSVHAFNLYTKDGSDNWGVLGLQSITKDNHTGVLYGLFGEEGGASVMCAFEHDESLKGYRAVKQSQAVFNVFSHQGIALYRPTPADPVRFFGGSYSVTGSGVDQSVWHTLRLTAWDYTSDSAPSVVRTWQLFDAAEFYRDNSTGNCRMNVTLSPDMRKLAARGRRLADDVYVYRVWDVQTLLDMEGSDASKMYESSTDNPWGTYETDWQSLAFDGENFYGLYSAGGYTVHDIRVFSRSGSIVCVRPATMEGVHEYWTQRQFEGESLSIIRDENGVYDLYLGVNVASEDWTSFRASCVYNLTSQGSGVGNLLNDVQGVIDDVDTAVEPGLWRGEEAAFNGLLTARGYLRVIAAGDGRATSVIQIVNRMYDVSEMYARNGNYTDSPGEILWGEWRRFAFQDGILSVNRTTADTRLLKFAFYGTDRGGIEITSTYSGIEDTAGQVRLSAKPAGSDAETAVRLVASSEANAGWLRPDGDDKIACGAASYRWSQVYAATGSINTSDAREKQEVQEYPGEVLDAWGDVELRQFLFRDAVARKGGAARIHAGIVAQQVVEAFAARGLDAARYGLLCYDKWGNEYEDVEVVDAPAVPDADGREATPAKTHTERRLVTAAGDRYGIRYSEALCLEAAYQRRRAQRLEERVARLEALLEQRDR